MEVGIDLQTIEGFKESTKRSGQAFLDKVFTKSELGAVTADSLDSWDVEHLCGIFCAKEALFKAGFIALGGWQNVEILSETTGKPKVYLNGERADNVSVSISHSGGLCTAIALVK